MQTVVIYADDSALIASGKNVADIESTLSSELEYVSNWLIDNKLSLHLGKTQSILFGTKRRLSTGVKLNVICNGNVIESKSNVTYLGGQFRGDGRTVRTLVFGVHKI